MDFDDYDNDNEYEKTDRSVAMNEEFENLLQAQWEGRLDEAGRKRLHELSAADPALAGRLEEEGRLSGLLAAVGPSRAPRGLAERVFLRLDQQGDLPDAEDPQVVESRPARTIDIDRPPVRGLWRMPVVRWGLALAAMLMIGFQIQVILNQNRPDEGLTASSMPVTESVDPSMARRRIAQVGIRQPGGVDAVMGEEVPAIPPVERTTEAVQPPERVVAAVPTPQADAPSVFASEPVEPAMPPPVAGGGKASTQIEASVAGGQATATGTVADRVPAPESTRAPAPRPMPQVRTVALVIALPRASSTASPGATPSAPGAVLSQGFGPGATAAGQNGGGLTIQDSTRSLQGDSPSMVVTPSRTAVTKPATRRDIEIKLSQVGGTIEEILPVPGRPDLSQVRCRVAPGQLQSFLNALDEMGLQPAPAAERPAAPRAEPTPDPRVTPSATPVAASPTGGVSRVDRLKAIQGIEVIVDGAPAPTVQAEAPAGASSAPSRTASAPPTSAPTPGRYAVLDGAPLVEYLTVSPPPTSLATGEAEPRRVPDGPPIELVLWIQQP